jgi:prevent-host-death family protein
MKTASVTETKNNLSAILQQVREGETYVILDHGKPVARLEPVGVEGRAGDERRADLERRGLLRTGRRIRRHLVESAPSPLPKGVSAIELLVDERREGR